VNWHIITGFILIAAVITAAYLACCTNAGVGALNSYARSRGGTWHQTRFLCPGCNQRHHVGRPGPTGKTSCIHCAPPSTGGAR
jgi:hypothetical protein